MDDRSVSPLDPAARPTRVRYSVLAWLCTASMIAYIQRNCISVPADTIQKELGLSNYRMGWVMAGFYWTYALNQIPAGSLGKVWGTRRALPVYSIVWSVSTGMMGLAGGYVTLLSSRLVGGLSQAGLVPCSYNTVAKWFPSSARGLPAGMIGSFMSVGAVIASALTGFLIVQWNWTWQTVFIVFSLPGLVWSIWFYVWFRDRAETHASVNAAELQVIRGDSKTGLGGTSVNSGGTGVSPVNETTRDNNEPTPWEALLKSPTMWMICGQQFFRAAGYIFFGTWFPKYLQQTRGVSLEESGYLTALPVLAVVLGSALGGKLTDWILVKTGSRQLSRRALAVTCMLTCSMFIFLAYFVADATQAVLLISAGSFFAALGGPAAITVTMDLSGRHVATTSATMNMAGNAGAALCPIVVGWYVDEIGQWEPVLLFFVVLYVATALCWAFLNPDRPIFAEEQA